MSKWTDLADKLNLKFPGRCVIRVVVRQGQFDFVSLRAAAEFLGFTVGEVQAFLGGRACPDWLRIFYVKHERELSAPRTSPVSVGKGRGSPFSGPVWQAEAPPELLARMSGKKRSGWELAQVLVVMSGQGFVFDSVGEAAQFLGVSLDRLRKVIQGRAKAGSWSASYVLLRSRVKKNPVYGMTSGWGFDTKKFRPIRCRIYVNPTMEEVFTALADQYSATGVEGERAIRVLEVGDQWYIWPAYASMHDDVCIKYGWSVRSSGLYVLRYSLEDDEWKNFSDREREAKRKTFPFLPGVKVISQ